MENTIPIQEYQASSPERFSLHDDDKLVLYGGGSNCSVKFLANDPSHTLKVSPLLQHVDLSAVTLYILNTSFIMWFAGVGIELSYQSIVLHALKGERVLHLQVVSSDLIGAVPDSDSEFTSSVEIEIECNDLKEVNPLFANHESTVENMYIAMNKCSALHFDSDEESKDDMVPLLWINQDMKFGSTGNADDLEAEDFEENEFVAGMHVDVGYGSVAGSVRKRDGGDEGRLKRGRFTN